MLRIAGAFALCLLMLSLPAQAQRHKDWVLLGEKSVGFLVDRDFIDVRQSEDWFRNRSFRALHFAAERNELHLISVRVVYMNNYTEEFRIDKPIRPGREISVDLRGDRSYLRRIEMIYRSRPSFRGQAVIKVYGEPSPRRPERDDKLLLGEKTVGFPVDRDEIIVSRNEAWFRDRAFRRLYLEAERNDVHLMNLRIVYFNGYTEDYRVDKLIRAGQELAVDLKGDRSYLRKIEMTYRARPNFRGQAVVKVYGELARGRR